MTEDDLDEVMQIERASFSAPWSPGMFRQDLDFPLARCLAAKRSEAGTKLSPATSFAGLSPTRSMSPTSRCERISADKGLPPDFSKRPCTRHAGIGCSIVPSRFAVPNEAARGLPEAGIRGRGIRPKYYSDNNEDAMIMWLDLFRRFEVRGTRTEVQMKILEPRASILDLGAMEESAECLPEARHDCNDFSNTEVAPAII